MIATCPNCKEIVCCPRCGTTAKADDPGELTKAAIKAMRDQDGQIQVFHQPAYNYGQTYIDELRSIAEEIERFASVLDEMGGRDTVIAVRGTAKIVRARLEKMEAMQKEIEASRQRYIDPKQRFSEYIQTRQAE